MEMRIEITTSTTINSTRVKPRLPFRVGCAIFRFLRRLRIDIKHVLSAPRSALRIVGRAPHSPVSCASKWIFGNASQELDLLVNLPRHLNALHENFERLRVAVGTQLDGAELSCICGVLVFIDG